MTLTLTLSFGQEDHTITQTFSLDLVRSADAANNPHVTQTKPICAAESCTDTFMCTQEEDMLTQTFGLDLDRSAEEQAAAVALLQQAEQHLLRCQSSSSPEAGKPAIQR